MNDEISERNISRFYESVERVNDWLTFAERNIGPLDETLVLEALQQSLDALERLSTYRVLPDDIAEISDISDISVDTLGTQLDALIAKQAAKESAESSEDRDRESRNLDGAINGLLAQAVLLLEAIEKPRDVEHDGHIEDRSPETLVTK